jgi:hypothetical protein
MARLVNVGKPEPDAHNRPQGAASKIGPAVSRLTAPANPYLDPLANRATSDKISYHPPHSTAPSD